MVMRICSVPVFFCNNAMATISSFGINHESIGSILFESRSILLYMIVNFFFRFYRVLIPINKFNAADWFCIFPDYFPSTLWLLPTRSKWWRWWEKCWSGGGARPQSSSGKRPRRELAPSWHHGTMAPMHHGTMALHCYAAATKALPWQQHGA